MATPRETRDEAGYTLSVKGNGQTTVISANDLQSQQKKKMSVPTYIFRFVLFLRVKTSGENRK